LYVLYYEIEIRYFKRQRIIVQGPYTLYHPLQAVFILFISMGVQPSDCVFSQEYINKIYSTENGLPHNSIESIARDKTGFLWIGTWDGLSRFDGYEFKNYMHDPRNFHSINDFRVCKVRIDNKNNLWVLGYTRKLSLYNRTKDCFDPVDFLRYKGHVFNYIADLTTDAENRIWIIGSQFVAKHSGGSRFSFYELPEEILKSMADTYPEMTFDNRGNLFILIKHTLFKCTIEECSSDHAGKIQIAEKYLFQKPSWYEDRIYDLSADDKIYT
jgi:ligand-binding sensor domain-containing protein